MEPSIARMGETDAYSQIGFPVFLTIVKLSTPLPFPREMLPKLAIGFLWGQAGVEYVGIAAHDLFR